MRWESGRRSTNIEDRRGLGGGAMIGGGGIGMLILVLIISFITGTNPLELLQQTQTTEVPGESVPTGAPAPDDPQAQMVSAVLGSTEDVWRQLFAQQGGRYQDPVLVLFEGSVRSACGMASSAAARPGGSGYARAAPAGRSPARGRRRRSAARGSRSSRAFPRRDRRRSDARW